MSEWKEYKLQDAIEKFIDYRGKTPNKVDKGIPLITAKVIKDGSILKPDEFIKESEYLSWMTRGFPEINDILLTTEAPLGEVAIINDKNIALAQRIILLRGKPKLLNNNFLFYSLRDGLMQHRLKARASGSTVQGIKSSELKEVMIPLPDIEEQKRIANVLSCLDAKIDNLRRQNETLEEIARSIFKHWFIDFEFPNPDGKPYKSSGGAMVRSDLGDIPEGWRVGKLGDIADITSSKRIFSSEYVSEGIPFYRSKEIIELHSGNEITTELYISEDKYNLIKSKFEVPKAGQILLTSVGTIGVPYLIRKDDKFYFKDGNLTWIKKFRNGFNGVTVYSWIKSDWTQSNIKQNTIGSTQKALTIQALGNIPIFIPDSLTLRNYTQCIEALNTKLENNIYQIQTLTKARDALLPKLMSGQLRVKE